MIYFTIARAFLSFKSALLFTSLEVRVATLRLMMKTTDSEEKIMRTRGRIRMEATRTKGYLKGRRRMERGMRTTQ